MSASTVAPAPSPEVVQPMYERPKAVARRFGISPSDVYAAIYRGDLPIVRFRSRVLLIRPSDADAWFASQLQSA